jgi:hypothetical protein
MKYAVEMSSGVMIYIPSFIKIGSGIGNLVGGDTQTAWRSHKPTAILKEGSEDGQMVGLFTARRQRSREN